MGKDALLNYVFFLLTDQESTSILNCYQTMSLRLLLVVYGVLIVRAFSSAIRSEYRSEQQESDTHFRNDGTSPGMWTSPGIVNYEFSKEEAAAFLALQRKNSAPSQFYHLQSLQKRNAHAIALCEAKNIRIKDWYYKHEWIGSMCKHTFHSQLYEVACKVTRKDLFARAREPVFYDFGTTYIPQSCPEEKVCINDKGLLAGGGRLPDDIKCVDWTWAIYFQAMNAHPKGERPRQKVNGCSKPTQVPGKHDGGSSSTQRSFVISESASFLNGSSYKARTMNIRDLSSKWGFDRVLRHDVDSVSTTINVGSWRGQLQSKDMQFCLDMTAAATVAAGQWIVLSYTWYRAQSRLTHPAGIFRNDSYQTDVSDYITHME